MKAVIFAFLGLMMNIMPLSAQAADDDAEKGLKLPRFVSLRSELVNARSGPGSRYPIEWVYMQKRAPVEIVAEFELWRKIKDWQGSESWVHQAMLTGKRTVKVSTVGENNIYAKPDYKSRIMARVENEVVGEVIKCPSDSGFCHVRFDSIDGWMNRQDLYGVYPKEVIE